MRQIIVDFGVVHFLGLSIPLRIYGYGLMMVLGFLSGIALAQWRARRSGEGPEVVPILGILALVGGVAGARLAYVMENWRTFAAKPLTEVANVTSGGLIYYGGVAGGTVLVLAYLRLKRLPMRRYLDIVSVSLMVGLAFGRAGCLLNGCCYGGPCSEHWPLHARFPMFSQPLLKLDNTQGVFSASTESPSPVFSHQWEANVFPLRGTVDQRLINLKTERPIAPRNLTPDLLPVAAAQKSLPVRPAQLLALINALVIAGILWGFHGLRWREGQVFALLLMLYPLTRIVEEAIRDDNPHNFSQLVFTHNQVESMFIILVAMSMWLALRRLPPLAGRSSRAAQSPAEAPRSPRPQRGRTEKPVSRKGN